jgi:hypothetical protein
MIYKSFLGGVSSYHVFINDSLSTSRRRSSIMLDELLPSLFPKNFDKQFDFKWEIDLINESYQSIENEYENLLSALIIEDNSLDIPVTNHISLVNNKKYRLKFACNEYLYFIQLDTLLAIFKKAKANQESVYYFILPEYIFRNYGESLSKIIKLGKVKRTELSLSDQELQVLFEHDCIVFKDDSVVTTLKSKFFKNQFTG